MQEAHCPLRSCSKCLLFWGGSLCKNFFRVWTCIKPNLVSKIFPFTGGGSLCKNFFFQSEHVSSQIWCQKFSPLLWVRYPLPPSPSWHLTPPRLGPDPPPRPRLDRGPPTPPSVNRLKLLPSPILRMAGGNKFHDLHSYCISKLGTYGRIVFDWKVSCFTVEKEPRQPCNCPDTFAPNFACLK